MSPAHGIVPKPFHLACQPKHSLFPLSSHQLEQNLFGRLDVPAIVGSADESRAQQRKPPLASGIEFEGGAR